MGSDFYVYGYFEIGNEKPFYIGKGRGIRSQEHFKPTVLILGDMFHSKLFSMLKKGQMPIVRLLLENLTEDQAFAEEKRLILLYGRRDLGTGCLCNQSDGGEGRSGFIMSGEQRKKLAVAQTGRIKTESEIERTRKKNTGQKRSEEIRQKMETVSRKNRGIPIESYDFKTGTTIKKYESIGQAAKENNVVIEAIYGVVVGRPSRKSCLGLGWRYTMPERDPNEPEPDPNDFANKPF